MSVISIIVENAIYHNKEIPKTVKTAQKIPKTAAVSSAEAKRGFSVMNICSDKIASLSWQLI
jgi:hypothetical protein